MNIFYDINLMNEKEEKKILFEENDKILIENI